MANRIGTYHKPNKTGRAWYVMLHGDKPQIGEQVDVMRKNGNVDKVEVYDPIAHLGGWLTRFKHLTSAAPTVSGAQFLQDDAAPITVDSVKDSQPETVQDTAEIDISAALEAARQALKGDADSYSVMLKGQAERAVKEASERITGRVVYVDPKGVTVDCGKQHFKFPELLRYVSLGFHVWLPGPAGSGKTTAAEHVAKALSLKFYHQGKVMFEHSLMGYKDAHGAYQRTVFREAWEHGGLMLLDECDSSEAKAMLAVNMIEQSEMAFPDGIVKRHADFRLIAAANTYGQGGDADYVGRNKLDGAFLDRFVPLEWPYDEAFETELTGNPVWSARVQALRAAAKQRGVKVLITPRASIKGAIALAAGIPQAQVERDFVKKGMTDAQWLSIGGGR